MRTGDSSKSALLLNLGQLKTKPFLLHGSVTFGLCALPWIAGGRVAIPRSVQMVALGTTLLHGAYRLKGEAAKDPNSLLQSLYCGIEGKEAMYLRIAAAIDKKREVISIDSARVTIDLDSEQRQNEMVSQNSAWSYLFWKVENMTSTDSDSLPNQSSAIDVVRAAKLIDQGITQSNCKGVQAILDAFKPTPKPLRLNSPNQETLIKNAGFYFIDLTFKSDDQQSVPFQAVTDLQYLCQHFAAEMHDYFTASEVSQTTTAFLESLTTEYSFEVAPVAKLCDAASGWETLVEISFFSSSTNSDNDLNFTGNSP